MPAAHLGQLACGQPCVQADLAEPASQHQPGMARGRGRNRARHQTALSVSDGRVVGVVPATVHQRARNELSTLVKLITAAIKTPT